MKQYLPSLLIFSVFAAVAVILWQTLDNLFYLVNFLYIGTAVSLGSFLYVRKYRHARRIVQLFVGLYMLVYLGLICWENMQILRYADNTTLMAESKETEEPLDKSERRE